VASIGTKLTRYTASIVAKYSRLKREVPPEYDIWSAEARWKH
jgi:hypothetical protein